MSVQSCPAASCSAALAGAAAVSGARRAGWRGDVHAIAVGCWGGAYGEALQVAVDGPLRRNAGITVRQVLSAEPARVADILAANGPSLDVALLSDVDAYRLSPGPAVRSDHDRGRPARCRMSLPACARRTACRRVVPRYASPIIRPRSARGVPSGFAALFEAARKGKVGFSTELAVHNLAAAAIAQRSAGASLEAAKSTFLALKHAGTLRIYPTNDALGQAFASGEIIMAPMWRSRAYCLAQGRAGSARRDPGRGRDPVHDPGLRAQEREPDRCRRGVGDALSGCAAASAGADGGCAARRAAAHDRQP